jgi:hypothetical protein
MNRLSKAFFLGSYLGGTIALWILACVMWALTLIYGDDEFTWAYTWPILPLILLSIYVFVVQCVFIYKAWASIQDGHVRTGPCKALGFLFIPFFNFYWIFQAVWGFAVDFNKYVARNNMNTAPRLPEGLFLAYCILYVVGIIPFVGIAAGVANVVIACILISKVCDSVNALPHPDTKMHQA